MNKKFISLLAIGLIAASFAVAIPALADTNQGIAAAISTIMRPNVVGKVSAISGNTLTVVSKQGLKKDESNSTTTPVTTTTFTIDATNAKILRGETVIKVSDIAVNDTIVVQGTITGTNVAATIIRDGKVGNGNENKNNEALLQIQGNGQPIVAGKITAVSGSTITITNTSNVTYAIDATSAKFFVPGVTNPTILSVAVGDNVVVQGTVNGNSVVASSVIDQKAKPKNTANNPGNSQKPKGFFSGMMGGIGNFFKRLFGF
ncbi:MAG: hypothetical protein NT026_02270 [Candidatus Staskawiczbacteria bacterium]|nr:hypothetical protein [Candidatus Staskawiczbacteria bacterium]